MEESKIGIIALGEEDKEIERNDMMKDARVENVWSVVL